LERNLLIENLFAVAEERHLPAFCFGPAADLHPSGIGYNGLATIDDGSTPNVEAIRNATPSSGPT
jgi:hypothetical protein